MSEANLKSKAFYRATLKKLIRESRDDSAEGMIKQLSAAVESFSKGTEQKDYLTAVVLKRNAGLSN